MNRKVFIEDMDEATVRKLNKKSCDIGYISIGSVLFVILALVCLYVGGIGNNAWTGYFTVLLLYFSVSAYACIYRPNWGRIVCIITSVGFLSAFPVGTIFGWLGISAAASSPQLFGKDRITSDALGDKIAEIEKNIS